MEGTRKTAKPNSGRKRKKEKGEKKEKGIEKSTVSPVTLSSPFHS